MARHLVIAVSAHGFGHLAQIAPIVQDLRRQRPDIRLTVKGDFGQQVLDEMLGPGIDRAAPAIDFGLAMTSPVAIDRAGTLSRYRRLHDDWPAAVAAEARALADLAPDLVLSNVGYLVLAAAAQAGLPALALSSLNWADILRHYWAGDDAFDRLSATMAAAYGTAEIFLRVAPGMAMPSLPHVRDIGPVGRTGTDRRDALIQAAGCDAHFVLVSYGGISGGPQPGHWPALSGVVYVFATAAAARARPDAISLEDAGLPFIDGLATADLLITKLGYGMFVEAGINRTRLLYGDRDDWPEASALDGWAARHVTAVKLPRAVVEGGDIGPAITGLLARPAMPAVEATGIADAIGALTARL